MASTKKRSAKKGDGEAAPSIVYIHGIGAHPPPVELKRQWDLALFGREMGARTVMAYWADILHPEVMRSTPRSLATGRDVDLDELLPPLRGAELERATELAHGLLRTLGAEPSPRGPGKKVLPLPAFLRKPIARAFLESFVKDTAAYFFRPGVRKQIRARLEAVLPDRGAITLVAHSQGTVVAYEVLRALRSELEVVQLVTLGSPLGIREVQDFLQPDDLRVPPTTRVRAWHNFADPLDPVAADKVLGNDFDPDGAITDDVIVNTQTRRLEGFNPHSGVGYLAHPNVRAVVHRAARIDSHARFLVARDVAAELAVDRRQPVLIEILEPGYGALGESDEDRKAREAREPASTLGARVDAAARAIEAIVTDGARPADRKALLEAARVDRLKRFVAAHLTPAEVSRVAAEHRDLSVYAVWKSTRKRKLIHRSDAVLKVDAARASYQALGQGVRWAVLDTGVAADHPHFSTHGNVIAVWDCTKPGRPVRVTAARDRDGHGTHVAGIVAGETHTKEGVLAGMAPRASLVVYKVLNDQGEGEDAWIIKALDHVAEQNENASDIVIHGLNLSLGGPYDATVYGCGFSPICVELRRLWRDGVVVVVACGNEGVVEVTTPDGELELNSPMSIGDPANLEDCIAVGSVNADRPHLYGISSFSSRGPTSDGRLKPDVVAPGERIRSASARFRAGDPASWYREESGTSMAAPHVSGLIAAFLSVRKEFRGRPDEVKELLLRTASDIGRDRYHQGQGIPNLMRMLLEA